MRIGVCLCVFVAAVAQAAIYKTVLPDGRVIFSDQKTEASTSDTLKPVSIARPSNTSVTVPINALNKKSHPTKGTAYQILEIGTPKNQQNFHNRRHLLVMVLSKPALTKGDYYQLLVDKKPFGKPQRDVRFLLKDLARGAHTLSAVILRDHKVMQTSKAITIFLHYTRKNQQP